MKILKNVWKARDDKFPEPRTGFGICRLLETMRHAGEFIPSKDFLRLYSVINDLRLGEITDDLLKQMEPELKAYYKTAIKARLKVLKDILMERAKSGILISERSKALIKTIIDAGPSSDDAKMASKDLLLQVSINPHSADKYGMPGASTLLPEEIDKLIITGAHIDMLIAIVKMCFLPPEWRALTRVPNASTRENAPHEYLQQNLLSRFADKKYDVHTPGVSRACTTDPFTLVLTTRESIGVDYGRPRSQFDNNYRILCDIYSGQ